MLLPAGKKSAERGGATIAGCAAVWLTATTASTSPTSSATASSATAAGAFNNHRQGHGKLFGVIISIDGVAAGLGWAGMEVIEVN
ncbi:MAG TPA: hypothetical protein VN765_14255 [Candidatus Acidoferrum sp.]|nr:hypothetical protein [Candidatus Acidoferrum sp.]